MNNDTLNTNPNDDIFTSEGDGDNYIFTLNNLTITRPSLTEKTIIFRLHFTSIYNLQQYLMANPPVNEFSFPVQKSITQSSNFAGDSLEQSIIYLSGGYTQNLSNFISLKRSLDLKTISKGDGRKTINSFVGGRPNVPAFIADSPKTMRRTERVVEKKFINIIMNLAYTSSTTDMQILNRGIITLNLISLLESQNIGVNFSIFEMVQNEDEIFDCSIDLKTAGESLDLQKCYFPLCGKEFLRRILARVKESTPFKSNWSRGYGIVIDNDVTRQLKHISDNHILISSPEDMGIQGNDLYEDANNFFKTINLDKYVSISD